VRFDKKHKPSSQRWLRRQAKDPYVKQAKASGYRSRAAFKLLELDDRFHFLKPGKHVIDLGAAPGGWVQVSVSRTCSTDKDPQVLGIDLLEIAPLPGACFVQGDFLAPSVQKNIIGQMPQWDGVVDVVLSDMAPALSGHASTDHLRIMVMIEEALSFAQQVLTPGGTFVFKTLQGGTESVLLKKLKQLFTKVSHIKPPASRKESSEMYGVAQGFTP
jgi:23S rRNA (uridine2552-2'-O)-methyltransferase